MNLQIDSAEKGWDFSVIEGEIPGTTQIPLEEFNRRKNEPGFIEWSQSRDPDNIPWIYVPKDKCFYQLPPAHVIRSLVEV